jgi:hypothetical protein
LDPGSNNSNKRGRGKSFYLAFLVATNIAKLEIIYFFETGTEKILSN